MGVVTCGGCGLKFNRNMEQSEFIKSKWYHAGCPVTKHEKLALDELICKIFGLKTPGPMNNVLIKKYRDELGYNYLGMSRALKYFYVIKKHTADKAEERIGIIPHVYQEAQDYFQYLESKKERIGKHALEGEQKEIHVKIEASQKTDKTTNKAELDKLFEEE